MGKSTPTPPTPPDPVVTARAQTDSNIETAKNNQALNMINTTDPYGSVKYSADPTAPGGFQQVTSLSPQEQQTYDLSKTAGNAALTTANQQIGRVSDALGRGFSYDGLPALQTSANGGQIRSNLGGGPPIATGFDPGSAVQTGFNTGPQQVGSFNQGQGIQGQVQGAGPLASSINTGGIQTGFNNGGALQTGFNQGQGVQGQVAGGGPIATGFNQGQAVQGQVGPQDFNQSVAGVSDAVWQQAMARLDPMWGKAQTGLDTKLANQGLGYNSQAYQNASQDFGRQRNDAYGQALFGSIQAGANEQNTLFNQSVQQGQFANQAAGQQYAQNQGQAAFQNNAQAQQYGQNLSSGQFANQAAGQQYAQNQGAAQFANSAAMDDYQRNQGQAQFANEAQNQGYTQQMGQAGLQNSAQAQQYGQNAQSMQLANAAAGQQFSQNQGAADFYNQNAQQQLQNNAAQAAFNNQAGAQQYAQNQGQAQFYNQASDAQYGRDVTGAQFANQAQNQDFQQQIANATLNNQARTQGSQEQAYAQNLPLNQFNALMSSSQVGAPQGINYTPAQQASTDVLGAYALNQQAQNANYQAAMQQQNGAMSGLFGLGSAALGAAGQAGGMAAMFSDRRLKTDVKRVGQTDDGLPVYTYRYKVGGPVQMGVMAQDVQTVRPEAVGRVGDYLTVDYGRL